tara:strand:- start:336 stop:470 length:135 start_codon:yes stop_codon:yes gene_type:complete
MEIFADVFFYMPFAILLSLAVYGMYILEVDKSEARRAKDEERSS